MASTKIVIETSVAQKEALYSILEERGITLTEWFNNKVAEVAGTYGVAITDETYEIDKCHDIEDSTSVLSRINEQDWSFTDADTGYLSHNIHPYPAKFIPQIPRCLIKMLSLRGEVVWDPFGGSGTTALEALLLGRQALSFDANPIATLIGKAKTITLTKEEEDILVQLVEKFELLASNNTNTLRILECHASQIQSSIPEIPNCSKWFHPNALTELGYIRWCISGIENTKCRTLAEAAFSKIIVKASFQASETRYTSRPRDVKFSSVLSMFAGELYSVLNKIRMLAPLLRFREAIFQTVDMRKDRVIQPCSVDLIVTSPPYPNATDYHLYHRFRLLWLGHNPCSLGKQEIGSHLRHQKENTGIEHYLDEMELCLHNMYDGLRFGRYAVLVLGNAVFEAKEYKTVELVAKTAQKIGFDVVGIVPREVHATKRSFMPTARRLREESLLVLRKPLQLITFELLPPPYTLWSYESIIRQSEIEKLLNTELTIDQTTNVIKTTIDPLKVDSLRRLTFTHGFHSPMYYKESTWQAILENGGAFLPSSKRKDPKYTTHGLHPYKGKFYPQLAKSLFNLAQIELGQQVLDPFCGSGTVLLEGYLNGLNAVGLDINPLAVRIARAKTGILTLDLHLVDKLLAKFIQQLEQIDDNESNKKFLNQECIPELESWFPELVLRKLGWIVRAIDDVPEPTIREFLEVSLSSIVREISQQDPKDLRIRRRKEPIDDAPVRELFVEQIRSQRERLRHFAQHSNQASVQFGKVQVFLGDCRDIQTFYRANLGINSVAAVITSPPYATALPYIDTDRLSILLLLGLQSRERSRIEENLIGSREISKGERVNVEERIIVGDFGAIVSAIAQETISAVYNLNRDANVGFRRKNQAALLYRYYADMTRVLSNLDQVTAESGSLFFVIGDNKTLAGGREVIVKSGQFIQETGQKVGWELADVIPITVTKENRLHNKNSITENDIIWFRKKPQS